MAAGTTYIHGSPIKNAVYALIALFLALPCALVLEDIFAGHRALPLVGIIKLSFFVVVVGTFLLKAVRNLVRRGPVVSITDDGLTDLRISPDMIPWSAVTAVALSSPRRTNFVRLSLEPEFERRYAGSYMRRLDRACGYTGAAVRPQGLKTTSAELLAAITTHRDNFAASLAPCEAGIPARSEPRPAGAPVQRTRPYATAALFGVLAALFAAEVHFAPPGETASRLSPQTLVRLGGMSRGLVDAGQWWRLLTAPLLHASLSHLLLNGLALVLGGYHFERLLGRRWFFLVFAGSALAGVTASYLLNDSNAVTVGASGGIMGLCVAAVVVAFMHPPAARAGIALLAVRIIIPTLIPPAGGAGALRVDYAAHIGGALGGLAIGLLAASVWDRAMLRPKRNAAALYAGLVYAGLSCASLVLADVSRSSAMPPRIAQLPDGRTW